MFKYSLNIGAIIGLVLVGLEMIAYILGAQQNSIFDIIGYVILALGLFYVMKSYREKVQNGYISYGQCMSLGFYTSLALAFILSAYLYIYLGTMDTSYLTDIYDESMEQVYASPDIPDDQIELFEEIYGKIFQPGPMAFISFFSQIILGVIFSLIIAIFVKNPEPFFENEG